MRFFLLLMFMFTSSLLAHKLNIFAYDEEGKLFVHSYFTKSSPCKGCQVSFLDETQRLLAKTQTNDEGKVSVSLPASSFIILVEAGMGHQQQIDYRAQSELKKELSDNNGLKIVLGLAIIFFLFGVLTWFKKRFSSR